MYEMQSFIVDDITATRKERLQFFMDMDMNYENAEFFSLDVTERNDRDGSSHLISSLDTEEGTSSLSKSVNSSNVNSSPIYDGECETETETERMKLYVSSLRYINSSLQYQLKQRSINRMKIKTLMEQLSRTSNGIIYFWKIL